MCTPFPLLQKNHIFYIFQLVTNINGLTVTGMVYTVCVYTVPVATKEPYFLYFSVSHSNEWSYIKERCIQNVCTPFPLLEKNHIFYIFQLATTIYGLTVTGTVYRKCVYTVPVATKEPYILYFSVSHSN